MSKYSEAKARKLEAYLIKHAAEHDIIAAAAQEAGEASLQKVKKLMTFPSYYRHSDVSCFNCGGDFGPGYWYDTDNPRGQGRYAQDCPKCRFTTFYDIERDPDEERDSRIDYEYDKWRDG